MHVLAAIVFPVELFEELVDSPSQVLAFPLHLHEVSLREHVFLQLSGERVVAAPQPLEEHANASRNASGAMPIAPSVKLAPSDMVTWAESRRSFICVIVTFGAGGVMFSPPYNKNDQRNNH